MKKIIYIFLILISLSIILVTLTPFIYTIGTKTVSKLTFNTENQDFIILFGAKVYPKNTLSPIMKQRADTTILIYKKKSTPIIISGSGKYEVDSIENYLLSNNINKKDIIKDYYGYDTHDTIRHLSYIPNAKNKNFLMISQNFHLFRLLQMTNDYKLNSIGVVAELISPHDDKNIGFLKKTKTKIERHYRNAILFWLYKFGIYDVLSDEAERKESYLKSNQDVFTPNIY